MNNTVEEIREMLQKTPELLELARAIKSFPEDQQPEAYRTAARFLESRKKRPAADKESTATGQLYNSPKE